MSATIDTTHRCMIQRSREELPQRFNDEASEPCHYPSLFRTDPDCTAPVLATFHCTLFPTRPYQDGIPRKSSTLASAHTADQELLDNAVVCFGLRSRRLTQCIHVPSKSSHTAVEFGALHYQGSRAMPASSPITKARGPAASERRGGSRSSRQARGRLSAKEVLRGFITV